MLKYIPIVPQTFKHSSGAEFRFRPSTLSSQKEWRQLCATAIPATAISSDPATKETTLNWDLLPAHVQASLNMDGYRFPAYLLESCSGVVGEDGEPHDIGQWPVDQRTDLILTACESDLTMKPWLDRLIAGPEKKSTGLDTSKQLVGPEVLPGLSQEKPGAT